MLLMLKVNIILFGILFEKEVFTIELSPLSRVILVSVMLSSPYFFIHSNRELTLSKYYFMDAHVLNKTQPVALPLPHGAFLPAAN